MSIFQVQAQDYELYGAGITSAATSITLTSCALPNSGSLVTMSMFGDIGYATLEPETPREENISFTGITQNANGTATLTGVVRALRFDQPFTASAPLAKSHIGGSILRFTNSSQFYELFGNKSREQTITGLWHFPATTADGRPRNLSSQNALLSEELITKGEVTSLITTTVLPPIVVSSSSATTGLLTAGSLTWAHTHTGTNGLLTVQVVTQEDRTITGITYNGDALTQQVSETRVVGNLRTEIWTRVNPDLGTNNIVVTMSAAALITGSALSFNNVNQATPIGDTNSADGSSVTPSTSITSTQINSVLVDSIGTANDPLTATAGAGQFIQEEILSAATRQIATSIESAPSIGAYTLDYTISPSTDWTIAAVEVLGLGVPGIAGVTQIIAGTNITISPIGGTGVVTVNSQEMEVQENGGAIETDTDTWNFTGAVNVTNPAPGVVDIDIQSGGFSNTFYNMQYDFTYDTITASETSFWSYPTGTPNAPTMLAVGVGVYGIASLQTNYLAFFPDLDNTNGELAFDSLKQAIFQITIRTDADGTASGGVGFDEHQNATDRFPDFQGLNTIGVGFIRDDAGQWYARSATGAAFTETAIAVPDSATVILRCEYDPGNATPQARFYVDGSLVATLTTNIPTASAAIIGFSAGNESTVGESAMTFITAPSFSIEI